MQNSYRTIKTGGTYEKIIRKSRFICHLKRTQSEEEATAFIEEVKKEHYKATHNCSAFVIGRNNEIQRANDDGEPSGTAGIPMLEVLKKNDLQNLTAVVTRYYGGIKLGAGGLIRAYSGVLSEALQEVSIVEVSNMKEIHLSVPYPVSGKIENELRSSEYVLNDILYTDTVSFVCLVKPDQTELFKEHFTDASNGQAAFSEKRVVLTEVPV